MKHPTQKSPNSLALEGGQNELPEASQVTEPHKTREEDNPELSSEVQNLKEKLNEHSKQLEQSAEKLSQLESENLNLQDETQSHNMASNKKRQFRAEGAVPGTGPGVLRSGEPGCLLAGTQRPVSCLGQDIAPVILRSRVPLRPEPYSEPGGGPVPLFQTGKSLCIDVRKNAWGPVLDFIGDFRSNSRSPRVFQVPVHDEREGTVPVEPRNLFPRVASSLWCVEIFVGAFPLSNFPCLSKHFSAIVICSNSNLHFKLDLALDSSSIGGRVRSKKQRSEAGPSESMDCSGSSLDLTAEVENPSRAVADVAPSGSSFVNRSG
ncbi:hypothetical protein HID58_070431 [Brassica napus]|uniref:Uncharacterized protein n=1 Tax=Brassica napus TaxID=3708 RepID=A0ABQ7YYS1_BRANA|nr:hypothetical protein HID58_070431 [Brassica napus]